VIVGTEPPAHRHGDGGIAAFGLIALIFGGFRSGFATATEISAFAVVYALLVAARCPEMTWRGAGDVIRNAAVKSGMVLFIVRRLAGVGIRSDPAAASAFHRGASRHALERPRKLAVSVALHPDPDRHGVVLEGAAALIIFGPLLMPVARQLGFDR